MTEKLAEKRGNYMKECAKCKEEVEKYRAVLKDILMMTNMYYTRMDDIAAKVRSVGISDK